MEVKKFGDLSLYPFASEVIRVGNEDVKAAREENHRLGLPNGFFQERQDKIYYQLPNGDITTESPLQH